MGLEAKICFPLLEILFGTKKIWSSHSTHNAVDRRVLQAMWEELASKVGHREQLTTPI